MRTTSSMRTPITLAAISMLAFAGCSEPHAQTNRSGRTGFQVALSTRIGGSGNNDMLRDVATDAAGNIYITGGTNSRDFPVTENAFDQTFNNPGSDAQDVFVTKLSPSGDIIWSTFIGGPGYDRAYAIELDARGFVYVAGRAGAGFPVSAGALQTKFGGGDAGPYGTQDGFVCKLTPDGSTRVFCTYFGNEDIGVIRDIAVDSAGNVLLITSAAVGAFPATWFANRYQRERRGDRDVLIAKMHASGSRIEWATYLGGSGAELNTNTIRVGRTGDIFALINTRSGDMPTVNAFDRTLGGNTDLYLARLSADGSSLLFGTYIGGSDAEGTETHHLWLAPNDEAVVTGITHSTDFPVTPSAFQRVYGGSGGRGTGAGSNYGGDGFIARIASDGRRMLAATYVGGRLGDGIEGVGVDRAGNIYVGGSTLSNDFPVTTGQKPAGGADIFGAVFSPDLSRLQFAVRIGGSNWDTNRSAFVDPAGRTFLFGGIAISTDFPHRNAAGTLAGHGQDAALVKVVRVK